MQVQPHPQTGQLLMLFEGAVQHEGILQRIARRVDDTRWLTVFRVETVNILKRMGYEPPELMDHYRMGGKYAPYAHQVTTTKFLVNLYRGWCLNGMRSGKTSSAAWAADALLQFGDVKRVLVLSPLSIMETSWQREFFYANPKLTVLLGNGSIARLKADLKRGLPNVLVLNHDKLRFIPNLIASGFDPDLVIVDEATGFKDHTSNRYGAMQTLMAKKRRLWLLTGTPCPNGPLDVWALSRFVNPATPTTLTAWTQATMLRVGTKLVPLKDAEERVAALLQPSIRFRTQDCIDMPQQTYHDIDVALTSDQKKAYTSMLKHMRSEYNDQQVVAVNAAVALFKLLQIAAGVVLDDDSNPVVIGAKPRLDECRRLIDQAEGKAIIISPFTEVQKYIADNLGSKYSTAIVNGSVTGARRTEVFDSFQDPNGPRVLIAHPQVIQYGLTLSAASMSIWWTGTFRTEHFIQANERMRGPDTHKTGVYMLQATPLERRVFKQVQENSIRNDTIIDMYREIMDTTGE